MNNNQSIFEKNIQRGIEAKIISLNEDKTKITYHCLRDFITSFKNPEEKVRASYFTELALDYNYPKEKIDFEIKTKPDLDKADIVIYEDDELKSPYLVVECKKNGITDTEYKTAIDQAFRYANYLRAKFASVVAGTTKTSFDIAGFKPSERAKNVISDIPKKYGKTPKYRFIKGEPDKELKIVSRDELIKALEKAHDSVWQGGKLAPTTAFDEVSKLLFCKLKDEKITPKEKPYLFQIGTHELPDEVYKRVNSIYQKAKKEDAEVFKEDIKLEPKIVYSVVEHLQALAINKIDLDTKGVAFERFLGGYLRGDMGQYFTPRQIIQFCVKIMNPERGELILDPACGSGGFLLNALDFVRNYADKNYDEQEARDHWHSFAKDNLYGIEINDQIARVCKMNMIIHDDGHTNIISTDALENFDEITKLHPKFKKDHFDLILTNPPFGAMIKRTEKNYLDKYKLGEDKQNQKSEILFIERCIDFVKPKTGRIAIVLPDGILNNSLLQYIRDFIMERCQILGVVSLPQFAFTHFGAGIKSSLVFIRRRGENEKIANYPIFMAVTEHIGYNATGRTDPKNDLDMIFEEYNKFLKNTKNYADFADIKNKYFVVWNNKITGRLDPYFYKSEFSLSENKSKRIKQKWLMVELGEVCDIEKGTSITKAKVSEGKIPVIAGGQQPAYYHNKSNREGKTITISSSGAYAGFINYFDFPIFASDCTTIKAKDENKLLTEFVFYILKSKQKDIYKLQRGAGQPHVYGKELAKIIIPVPPLEIQNKIIKIMQSAHSKDEKLKAEAKNEIEKAKKEVEKIILGK